MIAAVGRSIRDGLTDLRSPDFAQFVDWDAPGGHPLYVRISGLAVLIFTTAVTVAAVLHWNELDRIGAHLTQPICVAIPVFGVLLASALWMIAPWLPMWAFHMVAGTVILLAVYVGGLLTTELPGLMPVLLLMAIGIIALYQSTRLTVAYVLWLILHMAILNAVDDLPAPSARTLAVAGGMAAVAYVIRVIVGRLRAMAIAEQASRRHAEQLSAALSDASRRKSAFLGGMSHELRTPLNAIIGFSEVLGRQMFGDLNERQGVYVNDIVDSGQHLLSLVNDSLDLSKVEAGRLEIERGVVDVDEMLQSGLAMVRERASGDAVTIDLDVDDDAHVASGDARKIRQVIFNLLANAVRFTPAGGSVRVSARRLASAIEITVSDTGPGVADEDADRIFEEFAQANAPNETAADGTGLGLALSRRIVELHGGRIWLDRRKPGATFRFTLPDAGSTDRAATASPSREVTPPAPDAAMPSAVLARLGAGVAFLLGAVGVLTGAFVDTPGFRDDVLILGGFVALAASAAFWRWADAMPQRVLDVAGLVAILGIGLAVRYSGPLATYIPAGFVAVVAGGWARSRAIGITYAATAAAVYAVALATTPGSVPEVLFIGAATTTLLIAGLVRFHVVHLGRVVESETAARAEAERVAAELAEVSRHKSAFLAGMSHELRTPLNAIIGFSEVLDRQMFGRLNERQSLYVNDIVESGRHLLALVNDILDLAKIEAGKLELDRRAVDVSALVGSIGVDDRLSVTVDTSATTVDADERRLAQVLRSVVANALTVTPPDGTVLVNAVAADGLLTISVTDDGPGMTVDEQERIFDEFAQVAAGPTKAKARSGLGLALARRLVELHGGTLTVTSAPGDGATFTCTLPIDVVHAAATAPTDDGARDGTVVARS
jgi:signal transduction histidine kinase